MQNKILKRSIILVFIFIFFLFQSQLKKVNVLIMIDEKPSLINENLQINSKSMDIITANYIVGTIDFSEDNYTRLLNDKSSYFNLNFEAIVPKNVSALKYSIAIPKDFLYQKYIIINIFNMDNKIYKRKYSKLIKNNKEYYVVIETPNSMKFD